MHPFGLYLVATDIQRDHRWVADRDRNGSFARVDALPITEPEPVSRIGRLAAILRQRVMRLGSA
jgi:hypothetical protein